MSDVPESVQEMRRARSKIKCLIYGVSSLGNISGHLFVTRKFRRSDTDAMRSDFELVGRDIQGAMRTHRVAVLNQSMPAIK
jgi:hypothetical protein